MNPLRWKRERQIALAITVALGAAFGVILSYFVAAASFGADGGVVFSEWVLSFGGLRLVGWALFGATAAAAMFYAATISG